MRDILAARNWGVLRRHASGRVLLAFDLDGTLAPLAADPERVRLRPGTRRLLDRVARRYPCAVITGRQRAFAQRLLEGIPIRWLVGNHGLEWPTPLAAAARYRALVAGWARQLRPLQDAWPGVLLENKRLSLSVHVRNAERPAEAQRAIAARAAGFSGCRQEPGIKVLNLLPRGAPDKGHALLRLLRQGRFTRAIYVGDDVSDEAVFALGGGRVLGVRVGANRSSRARYFIADQGRIDALLRVLHDARFEASPLTGVKASF